MMKNLWARKQNALPGKKEKAREENRVQRELFQYSRSTVQTYIENVCNMIAAEDALMDVR